MLYPLMKETFSFAAFAATVKDLASRVGVPVGLHLDHCSDYELILQAIRDGFTSVMADGSSLPFDENVAFTSQVVKTAHAFGVEVEGELGHVGQAGQEADYTDKNFFTRPDEAARFAELTRVDALAIAFGSAHGFYKTTPNLDMERLTAINSATGTPLVLHGGSGIPDGQLKKAFTLGINKFNIGTEFFALNFNLKKEFWSNNPEPMKEDAFIRGGLTDYVAKKLELCKV
jgi:fructose-bisphosphate aldolase class II/tagatose 1,6-diphosphate aldolase GatY/KbaY